MRRLTFKDKPIHWALLGAGIGVALFLSCYYVCNLLSWAALTPTAKVIEYKLAKEGESFNTLTFDLVDPAASPDNIRAAVTKGYKIIVDTQNEAKGYAGDRINCTNCHFAGGISTGGKGGGIPLAGVAAKYPIYDKRAESMIDLSERVNMCFERSMNGKPLPLDSDEMLGVVTYLHWISRNFPTYAKVPWLGVKLLTSTHKPDIAAGKEIYNAQCALCHKEDGKGEGIIPPLWGEDSFNDGAGMSKLTVFAGFVYANMPYMCAELTEEQALDVASYVVKQPRPSYQPK